MKVILSGGQTRDISIVKARIEDVLISLGINPVEVVVARNGKVVSELDFVREDDELKVMRIVHGG